MADNFDMKKFLVENQLGAYSRLKTEGEAAYEYEKGKAAGEKEEKAKLKKEDADTQAEKMMDFLAEYEVIYVVQNGRCYRKDDEGNMDEVDMSKCRQYAEGKDKTEESTLQEAEVSDIIMQLINDPDTLRAFLSSAGKLALIGTGLAGLVKAYAKFIAAKLRRDPKFADKSDKELEQMAGGAVTGAFKKTASGGGMFLREESTEEALSMQAANRMNGLIAQSDLKNFILSVENITNDLENEGFEKDDISDYIVSLVKGNVKETKEPTEEAMGGKNPEGDKLVLRFLQGVAKKFDYPVAKAAIFVKDTIKSLGY